MSQTFLYLFQWIETNNADVSVHTILNMGNVIIYVKSSIEHCPECQCCTSRLFDIWMFKVPKAWPNACINIAMNIWNLSFFRINCTALHWFYTAAPCGKYEKKNGARWSKRERERKGYIHWIVYWIRMFDVCFVIKSHANHFHLIIIRFDELRLVICSFHN